MNSAELQQRTKSMVIRIAKLVESLPKNRSANAFGNQLIRSGSSVGANYRAACRAKSRADFINRIKICEEECDESLYWMELLEELGHVKPNRIQPLKKETEEILSILVASAKTARSNSNRKS